MLDAYRNATHDLREALAYYEESYPSATYYLYEHRRPTCFKVTQEEWTLPQILAYDDYTSWGGFQPGELRELSPHERLEAMRSYRGHGWARMALQWWHEGIPAVVLVESSRGKALGDGRGRVSFAVGMGIERLPVVRLRATRRPPGMCW
jgi:hypothetical protein